MRCLSIPWAALGTAWALALCTPAMAYSPPSAMSDGRVAGMSGDDLALARACLRDALDEVADGIVHFWTNARTRASGTVTPIRWLQRDGMDCRHVEITFQGVLESSRNVWTLCQGEEGWTLLRSS
jgi:surface antigen